MEKRIEMVKSMLTRENLLKIFKSFGIQKGMLVLVETNGSLESYIAGGEQMVIEVLKEMLGNQGCIIAPVVYVRYARSFHGRHLPVRVSVLGGNPGKHFRV